MCNGSDGRDPEVALDELDQQAQSLIAEGRPERLGAVLIALRSADFDGHPWAALAVAAGLQAVTNGTDSRIGELLDCAEMQFRRCGDERGSGFAAYVRGSCALGRGDVAGAALSWHKARQNLGEDGGPLEELVFAQLSLAQCAVGQLQEALRTSEQALALARTRRNRRAEALALLYLAFFSLWAGDFERAQTLLATSRTVYTEITDPFERFEWPLVEACFGVLHALRGHRQRAERAFLAALGASASLDTPWFAAITRALRAEFCAPWEPIRSMADARAALDFLADEMRDEWWCRWARRALAVADMYAGNMESSTQALRLLLGEPLNGLERAWTEFALSECRLRAGDLPGALACAQDAQRLADESGSRYLQARARCLLAEVDPQNRDLWRERAQEFMGDDDAYRALFTTGAPLRILVFGPGRILLGDDPVKFATRHAEAAVFILALAGRRGIDVETLAEGLWPNIGTSVWPGRVRTLLWQIRRTLGSEAWRVQRDGRVVRLELAGAVFDFAEIGELAHGVVENGLRRDSRSARLVELIHQPLLTTWQYEEWRGEYVTELNELRRRLATVELHNGPQ